MSAYMAVAFAAAFAAGLTLYSGFGLGTLLLPVFALFMPVEAAVVATAIVHGANNVFKVSLVGRFAAREIVLRFGLPAIVAAFGGALLLGELSGLDSLHAWSLGSLKGTITPVKLSMGCLIGIFAGIDLLPADRASATGHRPLFLGGLLSGFFGGLSGHQGALRAAFLVKAVPDTRTFVGTSATIGLMVDGVRVVTYLLLARSVSGPLSLESATWSLMLTGCLAAFTGVVIGKRYLHRVRITSVRRMTGGLLMIIAGLLITGLI